MTARLVGRTGRVRGTDVDVNDVLTVGSGAENGLRIQARTVSRRHAQIVKMGTEYYVEDLGSRNSTFLNGQPVKRFPIRHLDVLSIGPDADLIFMETGAAPAMTRPSSLRVTIVWINGPLAGQVEDVPAGRGLVLGRRPDLPLGAISRKHAALTIKGDYVTVEDLGSANGTWVNGESISTMRVLSDGDEIALGNLVRCRVSVVSGASPETAQFIDSAEETIAVSRRPEHGQDAALEVPRSATPGALTPAPQAPPQVPPPAAQTVPPARPIVPPPAEPVPSTAGTMAATPEAAGVPPLRIGQPPVPEEPPPTDGTMVATRAAAVIPSFGDVPPGEPVNTAAPPRQPAGGVPQAVASRAQAAREGGDVTVAATPAPPRLPVAPQSPVPSAGVGGGALLGARLEGAGEFLLRLGTFHVGRHSDCEVRIEVRDLGRKHARLTVNTDAVIVEDLDSANGTFVDDERVTGPRVVPDGSRVRFATVEFTVTYLRSEG
ncbi:MAG TPA: FHA domain-containing protein [Vicinamibacterales bacterium]|nr:FHA domain-containing protein [Vicinamibacterales bacterium]